MTRKKPEIKKVGGVPKMENPPQPPLMDEITYRNLSLEEMKRYREDELARLNPGKPELQIKPKTWVKVFLTVVQWVVIATVLCFGLFGFHFKFQLPQARPMDGWLVILTGVSFAFVWVDVLKWGVSRPWNCVTCLSGWFSLLLAIVFNTHFWYIYLGIGCFTGHLFTLIRLRWL